ncbi:hypothetical protein C1H46_010294 [Malus baccata]|uniref:Uncharacterized protein n=1 Tax=Malus baccata TaxID=106549 RepID=A0A540MZ81_MALBA|nr:hypothetical protein C1H46_010294 [Malus baccata]
MAVQQRGWFWPSNPSAIHVAATFAIIVTHTGRRKLMAALGANMSYACIGLWWRYDDHGGSGWIPFRPTPLCYPGNSWRPTPPDISAHDSATHDSCQFYTCISIMDTSSCYLHL